MSDAQEQAGQNVGSDSNRQNVQAQQDVSAVSNKISLIIDGSVGVVDVIGVIDKINQDLRSISSRIEGFDGSLRSLKDSVDTIPSIKQDLEAVKRDASISKLIGVVGLWKLSLCINNRSGVCYAWRLGDNIGELSAIYGDQAVVEIDGTRRVRVSIAYHLCGICPLFRPRTA